MRKPTVISVGLVVAAERGTNPAGVDWRPLFKDMGFRLCGQVQVRGLDRRFDVPHVLEMHEDDPIAFNPDTQFVSLTAPVLWEGSDTPFYDGTPEVTALVVDEQGGFTRPRSIVDKQDTKKYPQPPGGLIVPGAF